MVEQVKRKVGKKRYVIVFVFTTLIFLVGIAIGWQFSNYLMRDIAHNEEILKAQIFGLELKYDLMKQGDICEISSSDLWMDRVQLGNQVDVLERRLGKQDKDVLVQKEVYQLVELETLLLLERIKEGCDLDVNVILFFYTNLEKDEKGSDTLSETQGAVLDNIYANYGNNVAVFAFDINTDNPALNTLRQIYDIEEAPTLVINGEAHGGYQNYPAIVEILGF